MNDQSIALLFEKHKLRQAGLDIALELLELTELIQQHRGYTLAVLGGNNFFESRVVFKSREIDRHLQSIKVKLPVYSHAQADHPSSLREKQIKALTNEWLTISQHWRKDSAFECFLLHSHFINQVLKLIWDVAEVTGHLDVSVQHNQLVLLGLRKIPELIENIAQSRGLGVHIVSTPVRDDRILSRLDYLSQSIVDAHIQIVEELKGLNHDLSGELKNKLLSEQCYDQLLDYTKRLMALPGNQQHNPKTADLLFAQATRIITLQYEIARKTIRSLNYSMEPAMQSWVGFG
ncbi:MAG: hypothetical protein MI864_10055 [Pseudomonadales bacterium]|uniref:Uncharacterized protein n=1 Tax=Oleiphilus messinensis TaxID=141451 RepID=A0A1Y0I3E4_9GAMM|nr:hypothetical protein [Oleiphilus messinensis]ARU55028.1 hypothetical protein OLMES_0941 [Oleiphilus messinensis]MCG8610864.1 hypothetical protein [Pseudomonadales bacterium]